MDKIKGFIIALMSACMLLGVPGPGMKDAAAAGKESFWNNAIVYFVLNDRFCDGNPSNNNSYGRPQIDATGSNIGTFHGGDIAGLTKKLKEGYFTNLGVNAIWMSVPYEQSHGFVGGGGEGDFACYAFHGYWALDFTMMDRNMGTVEEMREFVTEAHRRNIRVIMDVVMNHAGYDNIADMKEYGYGCWKNGKEPAAGWKPDEDAGETWHSYHDLIDYADGEEEWDRWWGGGWVRAGIAGYEPSGSDEETRTLDFLPDFRTEETEDQGLPGILTTKWGKETSPEFAKYIVPSEKKLRKDLKIPPSGYLVRWLAAWVEEFGIDGFRADTAKHVEKERWLELKKAASAALETWRKNNPGKPGASWTEPFWMTGEVWGHGVKRDDYYDNGFDSLINFEFVGTDMTGPAVKSYDELDAAYSLYSRTIGSERNFNVLSYISSHDTNLYDRKNLLNGMTNLLLCPGAVQIFYGDESGRPEGPECSDPKQLLRSDMNWNSIDARLLSHTRKLAVFRLDNIAVAAGTHARIDSRKNGYAFTRVRGSNRIAAAVGAEGIVVLDVSSIWKDGIAVVNAYDGTTGSVRNGTVTFCAGPGGVVLVQERK